jgi:oligopeptide transport system substrate-binding protein
MKKWKRIAALALAALMTASLAAGCGQRQEDGIALSAAVTGRPTSFDPALAASEGEQMAAMHLYENLMRLQSGGDGAEVVGGVARRWQCVDNLDGTETYTFTLRSDARWSDGKPVRAGDFVYAWQHLVDPASNSPNAALLDMVAGYEEARRGDLDALQVRAKDSNTLEVVLSCRCHYFLRSVCAVAATMPRRADLAGSSAVVSNGPYAWGGYSDGVLTMTASEQYYDRRRLGPETVTIRYCDTAERAAALFEAGTVDFVCGLTDEAVAERGTWDIEPYPETALLVVNQMSQQLEDRRLRQALSLAVDRRELAELAGAALQSPAEGLVPYGIAAYDGSAFRTLAGSLIDNDDYEAGCDRARELLAQARMPTAAGVTILYADRGVNAQVAQQIQTAWQEQLGLTAALQGVEPAEMAEALRRGAFSVALMDTTADRNDAGAFLNMWRSGGAENVAQFHSDAYDMLLRVADASSSAEARDAYLADAERLLLEQGNVIPLYFTSRAWQIRSGLTGLLSDGRGVFYFGGVRRMVANG